MHGILRRGVPIRAYEHLRNTGFGRRIGEGFHERFIIDGAKFLARVAAKAGTTGAASD
jgi:predicted thioesterase